MCRLSRNLRHAVNLQVRGRISATIRNSALSTRGNASRVYRKLDVASPENPFRHRSEFSYDTPEASATTSLKMDAGIPGKAVWVSPKFVVGTSPLHERCCGYSRKLVADGSLTCC